MRSSHLNVNSTAHNYDQQSLQGRYSVNNNINNNSCKCINE